MDLNDKPEEFENLVTYTYDHLDRLLYRNVYKEDVPYMNVTNPTENWSFPNPLGPGSNIVDRPDKRFKKLLYQDVYNYKGKTRLSPTIKRVYQPEISFTGAQRVGSSDSINLIANVTCRSKILASGFVWRNSLDNLRNFIFTPLDFYRVFVSNGSSQGGNSLNGEAVFGYPNCLGKIQYSFEENDELYVKVFAQIETGTLFSETLTVPSL
jgi:hypothetical protein